MKIRPISDTPKTIPTDAERGPPPHLNGGSHSQNCPYTFSQLREKQIFGGALLWWGGLYHLLVDGGAQGIFRLKQVLQRKYIFQLFQIQDF